MGSGTRLQLRRVRIERGSNLGPLVQWAGAQPTEVLGLLTNNTSSILFIKFSTLYSKIILRLFLDRLFCLELLKMFNPIQCYNTLRGFIKLYALHCSLLRWIIKVLVIEYKTSRVQHIPFM